MSFFLSCCFIQVQWKIVYKQNLDQQQLFDSKIEPCYKFGFMTV